jgi:hypothetical protein
VIRLPAGLALAMVVGLVLGTDASWPVGVLVGVAATLGLGGILGHSFSLIGTSAGLLVAAYGLALAIVAPAPGVVIPVLLGAGLTLLLVAGEAVTRRRGGSVDRRVLVAWLRDVTGIAGFAGVVGIALGAAGGSVDLDLPAWGYPLVAGVGALAAVVGTGRALIASARGSGVDHGEDL